MELAVVIPAYKSAFLRKTLESIACQTCNDFILYIGDDNSPFDLERIVDEFRDRIRIVYRRFEENLGGKNLIAHWDRCVKMSSEPYVYFFSDDDMMPSDAVERIYSSINAWPGHRFFRFPLNLVDSEDRIIYSNPPLPEGVSSAEELMCDKLGCVRSSTACEYVFARSLYDECGGFVDLPLAWGSDDATWYLMAANGGGAVNIHGRPVMWRDGSGENISSDTSLYREKLDATTRFIYWLRKNYRCKNSRLFRKSLKTYINNIFVTTVRMDYTAAELDRICRALAGIDIFVALHIYFKFRRKVK